MASPLQFAYRTQKAIGVFDTDPVYAAVPGFVGPEGNLRTCVYSPCGRFFATATNDIITIVDASSGSPLASIPVVNVFEISFSPKGNFLSSWERPAKDENGDATKNLKIWRVEEDIPEGGVKQPLGQFVQKSQHGWNLQYTSDERYCARTVTNEVQFFDSNDFSTVWKKLRVEGVADFALSPGQAHAVAVFVPEKHGQPAAVKVFIAPQFDNPISQKTFFKGDKVQMKWNAQGSSLLVLAQTDVDKSNKSYYGETTLYLLSTTGAFDARVSLDKEGPIHDVAWSPNSKEFCVVYGYMPAKTTLFNHRAVATHSFPLGPRNTIIFSPTGRFLLLAGFGNLAGQIDVIDLERDNKKICTIESGNPSVCQWSPDSRYIMTATTSPRLRVDNGVKLWHVGGTIMYNEDMVELYNVMWRPTPAGETAAQVDPLSPVPAPHLSATTYLGTIKTPSKPAGAYRPPGARGTSTPLHFKREDEGGAAHSVSNGISALNLNGSGASAFGRSRRQVPGAEFAESGAPGVPGAEPVEGNEGLSKAALKNKKKRGNKKAKEGEGNAAEGTEGAPLDRGAALAPPSRAEWGSSTKDGRSPDRRGHSHSRSNSRNNFPGTRDRSNTGNRNRSNTARTRDGRDGSRPPRSNGHPLRESSRPPPRVDVTGPGGAQNDSQNPNAKKLRSLQKKIRAIEDLEMRLAGGEKLEDTQMKKIATKGGVFRELEQLEKS